MRGLVMLLLVVAGAGLGCNRVQTIHDADDAETVSDDSGDQEWAGGGEFSSRGDAASDQAYMASRCPHGFRIEQRVIEQEESGPHPDTAAVVAGAVFDVFAAIATKGKYHGTAFTRVAAATTMHDDVATTQRLRYSCAE